jgi:hypothetical protein
MINIRITNINLSYNTQDLDGAQVYFVSVDETNEMNLNGFVPLTAEQYLSATSHDSLKALVKEAIVNRL